MNGAFRSVRVCAAASFWYPLWTPTRYCVAIGTMSPSCKEAQLSNPPLSDDALRRYRSAFWSLLDDRRVCYRDSVLVGRLRSLHLESTKQSHTTAGDLGHPSSESTVVDRLEAALARSSIATNPRMSSPQQLSSFFERFILSESIQSTSDLSTVFKEAIQALDGAEWSLIAPVYTAVFQSLIPLLSRSGSSDGVLTKRSEDNTSSVFGQANFLSRGDLGELSSSYMGHALKLVGGLDRTQRVADSMHQVWSSFLVVLCASQVAPKLLDMWWSKMKEFYDAAESTLYPYEAVHAVLSATADNTDVERSFRVFHEASRKGLHAGTTIGDSSSSVSLPPGTVTIRQTDMATQLLQLRLLVKLMASTKSSDADGGAKALLVQDVRRLISPEVLAGASWEVINDLLCGLSISSSMHLVKTRGMGDGDETIPFMIWASLLRRCARDHRLDEAEALYVFIRRRFSTLTSAEKQELVSIKMRMHATLKPPDSASTLSTFLKFVEEDGDPEGDYEELYRLLITSADSSNASMMYFLEAAAAGVSLSSQLFESLIAPMSAVQYASKKLPHDYTASRLDSLVRIPANIDAHLRREEAMAACGVPVVDSTGSS